MLSVSDFYRVRMDVVKPTPVVEQTIAEDDDDVLTFSEEEEEEERSTVTLQATVTCNICQRVCASKFGLSIHMKTHTRKKKRILYEYGCKECSETFETQREMDNHVRKTHPLKPSKHICSTCKQGFETSTSFYKHVETAHPPKLNPRPKKLKNAECL